MASEAIDLARSLSDDHLRPEVLIVTGMPMSPRVSTAGTAIAHAQEGRAPANEDADAWLVAASFAVEGGARALTPDGLVDAVDLLERAGRGYTELGDRRSAEINAWYLSQAHEDAGDIERAAAGSSRTPRHHRLGRRDPRASPASPGSPSGPATPPRPPSTPSASPPPPPCANVDSSGVLRSSPSATPR